MADKDYALTTTYADVEDDNVTGNDTNQYGPTNGTDQQVFDRYINLSAIINFGFTLQCGWQPIGFVLPLMFLNGGPAAFVWGIVLVTFGALGVAASLGEMASMDPHVGAQYRWSAGFARKWPEFWGLLQGWLTVFAWLVGIAPGPMILAQTVTGIITFYDETYVLKGWHTTLLMIAFLLMSIVCNLFLRRILSVLETIGGITHVLFFVVTIVILTTMAERSTPEFVFTTVVSGVSGWESPGLCWNLGVAPLILALTNCDGVTHMIDETKNPRDRVPKTMLIAVISNATMALSMVITLLFCVGDLDTTFGSGQMPLLMIFYQATKSKAASTILVIMAAFGIMVSMFNCTASVTRLAWAFARDNGLPFRSFFSQVHPTLKIPLQILGLITTILIVLSFINLGSEVAFAALISIPTTALCLSYLLPITLLVIRKLTNDHPQYGPFRLGKWGVPINLWAMMFLIYAVIWSVFPTSYPITGPNMNYAGPIVLATILLCILDWFTTGKKRFKIPRQDFNNLEMYDQAERHEIERKLREKREKRESKK